MKLRVRIGRWLAGDNTALIVRDKSIALLKKQNLQLSMRVWQLEQDKKVGNPNPEEES